MSNCFLDQDTHTAQYWLVLETIKQKGNTIYSSEERLYLEVCALTFVCNGDMNVLNESFLIQSRYARNLKLQTHLLVLAVEEITKDFCFICK